MFGCVYVYPYFLRVLFGCGLVLLVFLRAVGLELADELAAAAADRTSRAAGDPRYRQPASPAHRQPTTRATIATCAPSSMRLSPSGIGLRGLGAAGAPHRGGLDSRNLVNAASGQLLPLSVEHLEQPAKLLRVYSSTKLSHRRGAFDQVSQFASRAPRGLTLLTESATLC